MRKREIHSVAHWAMMFLLLMFPLLMVVVGAFQNADYQPVEKFDLVENVNDLQINDDYILDTYNPDLTGITTPQGAFARVMNVSNVKLISSNQTLNYDASNIVSFGLYLEENGTTLGCRINYNDNSYQVFYNNFKSRFEFTYLSSNFNFDWATLDIFYNLTTIDNYHYKNDVNLWTKSFLDLPVNAWYKSLMNTVGVGFTNSSVMNVIYVMPVYILWVFIFDVIVDCFLVIIKLPHKLLNRLSGGENE